MLNPDAFNYLYQCQAQNIRVIPTPNYDYRAFQIMWHLRRTIGFDQWIYGETSIVHGEEYHLIEDIITWEERLYVSNLISLNQMSDNDLLLNILYGIDQPRVVVYGDYRILADGNHRWWHLANRGITEAVFKTIYFQDCGDLDWNAPIVETY